MGLKNHKMIHDESLNLPTSAFVECHFDK